MLTTHAQRASAIYPPHHHIAGMARSYNSHPGHCRSEPCSRHPMPSKINRPSSAECAKPHKYANVGMWQPQE